MKSERLITFLRTGATMTVGHDGTVTQLLAKIREGNGEAKDRLFHILHDELLALAQQMMRHERPGHTLQPTALLNEVCIRLLEDNDLQKAEDRRYVFGAAARAMRRVLVDHARQRIAFKQGGDCKRLPIDTVVASIEQANHIQVQDLDDVLHRLAEMNPRQAEVVTLRFFGGMKISDIAESIGCSRSTVGQDWRLARAWLHKELTHDTDGI